MKKSLKIVYFVLRKTCYLFSLPIACFLSAIFPVYRIRLIGLQSFRIGHYALNTELMLCALKVNHHTKKQKIFFFNTASPCNSQLYKMWKRTLPFFPFSVLAVQVDFLMSRFLGEKYTHDIVKKTYESCGSGAVDQMGFLHRIEKPTLCFNKNENNKAKKILNQMGISEEAKYICLVVRDAGYLNKQYPESDWRYHDHRNADIDNYKQAALFLAEKGYYVIRMGKYVEKQFIINHPNIIDYANHPLRSDFMDIYLSAHCYFCISTCTGLDCVSQIFRRPVLMTNISPAGAELLMWYPCTLYIPKLMKDYAQNRFLTLAETASVCKTLSKNILSDLKKKNLAIVENTPEDIVEVVKEMECRVSNAWQETHEQNELQHKYWDQYKKHCPVDVNKIYIKMGNDFLKKHEQIYNMEFNI